MQTEGESNPLKFSQMFHLAAQGSSFVITNGAPVAETLFAATLTSLTAQYAFQYKWLKARLPCKCCPKPITRRTRMVPDSSVSRPTISRGMNR